MRRKLLGLGTVLAAGALVACGGDDDADGGGDNRAGTDARAADVNVKAFDFAPDPVRVAAGTKVTWRNQDATTHTVTTGERGVPDRKLDGRLAESGGEFSATFDEPGTYAYFCSRHSGPGMEAAVIVK